MVCKKNKLNTSKPSSEGRLTKELESFELLDQLEIPYAWLEHELKMTIADCADIDKLLEIEICKNLFLCTKAKDRFFLLMMPGTKKFVTKDVSRMIGTSRLEFAPEEYMERYMHLTPGSVSVMGLAYDKENKVQLLIDQEVLNQKYIGCHPCINTASLRMSTDDFINKFLPAVNHEPILLNLELLL
ncbi:MAG: prolyl-tRNA synthetase associated domain-containing protein [Clostridia bacterium]|nr:prolyl-tRNA synthetase associated domain-containing protein [Clostridia bacterium]